MNDAPRTAALRADRLQSPRREIVASEILDRAAALFAKRGFQATTLQDIAGAMNVSRPSLYNYFTSKDDLLSQLVHGITRDIATRLGEIRNGDLDPTEKLRLGVAEVAYRAASNPARFVLLDRSESDLPEGLSREHRRARRDVVDHWTAIIREGIEQGQFRFVNERIVSYALLGMSTWVAWWFRPDFGISAKEVADEIAEMAVRSIDRGSSSPGGVMDIFGQLRDDLGQLERIILARADGDDSQEKS